MSTTGPTSLLHPSRPGTPARILVVDDEAHIVEVLAATLTFAGFEVRAARSGAEARQVAAEYRPRVALLDVLLPDGSGFDLCDSLREVQPELGVLFVTARDAVSDRLTGLGLADGYITKPFSVAEVIARLNVLLRRLDARRPDQTVDPVLRVGDLEVAVRSHRVSRQGDDVELTPTEFRVLTYLMGRPGLVVSKQHLLSEVWGHQFGDVTAVEKVVSQLRRKIGPGLLHTVRGFGYTVRDGAP
ncbi:response regulator transcription factor [Micromonospora sp. SCSIO 07396]|uniref:Response regulator transcription factor n=1 Tax=Micromonospora humidisoli TaxID=2807622 RepID=A0ABS2JJ20_9ACTN|nr:response regulator transcription factor [Micromonospora humidisoli]MBM7086488.1 response regulator transcription factor [Micromonospora humidisoli]